MKRNLVVRVAAAMVLAGTAAVFTGCGSNNNMPAGMYGPGLQIPGLSGITGGAIASGSGQCAPLAPTIAFQGTGVMDSANIYAGGNTGTQLMIQTASGSPSGQYYLGRIGSDGMIGMNAQTGYSGYGGMGYGGMGAGSQISLVGFFEFNQTSWQLLNDQLASTGGSYAFPGMGTYPGAFTGVSGYGVSGMGGAACVTAMAINLGYAPNYNQQYGPFQEVLYGGNIQLMLTTQTGQQLPATIPF